jgi:hypothetical protein
MIFRTHVPRFPLSQFVDMFVYFADVAMEHNFDRFLPNGDTEILIDFHDTPQYIYDNHSLKEIQACHHVWASGLRTEPITIPAGNKSEMMVVSFKKGQAAAFFPFPMDEIADSVVDADLVWGLDFALLRERLLKTRDIDRRFSLVEDFLIEKFRSHMTINPFVAFAIGEMSQRPDAISIARMNSKIGYSQKHWPSGPSTQPISSIGDRSHSNADFTISPTLLMISNISLALPPPSTQRYIPTTEITCRSVK